MPPTYEYGCDNGHEFEEVQSVHDAPLTVCPIVIPFSGPDFEKCEASVKRLLCPTAFILKGGGWFRDGY